MHIVTVTFLAFVIYILVAIENTFAIKADEAKQESIRRCKDEAELCLQELQTMSHTIERFRRQNLQSALLGAIVLCIPVYYKVDFVTFGVLACIVIASMQNFRAYHMEDELMLVLHEYFAVQKQKQKKQQSSDAG